MKKGKGDRKAYLEVVAGVVLELPAGIDRVELATRNDNIVDLVFVAEGHDGKLVLDVVGIWNHADRVGDVGFDALLLGTLGMDLDFAIMRVTDLCARMAQGLQVTKQADVGLVAPRGGRQSLRSLNEKDAHDCFEEVDNR